MSMRLLTAFSLVLASATVASAGAVVRKPTTLKRPMICRETSVSDEGDDVALGTITILFGRDGKANAVRVVRPKTETMVALNETLTLADSKITDVMIPGDIESVDEQTGEKYYVFGIEKYQRITAERGDVKVEISVDDHMYVGISGSTIRYKKGSQVANGIDSPDSGSAMVSCLAGRLKNAGH